MRRWSSLCIALLFLAACAPQGSRDRSISSGGAWSTGTTLGGSGGSVTARIIPVDAPLQCVPYARAASGIGIRGDAWTWWHEAEGHYRRSNQPGVGSVLVLKRTNQLRYGHLAVVTAILSSREILVRHANWLNRGEVHENTPVVDVSHNNDWSLLRFWYTPGASYGKRLYPANGFIHPDQLPDPMQAAL
jgi:hypothetical protein